MHCNNVVVLAQCSRPDSPQLLHVTSHAQQETQVDTQCPDVCSCLTADPEDGQVPLVVKLQQLGLVDGPDPQLTLHGRDERGPLEEGSGQGIDGLRQLLDILEGVVQPEYCHVLLTGSLLRLYQTGGSVDADDEAAGHFRVKGTGVTSLLHSEDPPDPCYDFVRRGVGGLVQVDHAGLYVGLQVTFEGGAAVRDGGEVRGADEELVLRLQRA